MSQESNKYNKYFYEKKLVWEEINQNERQAVFEFGEDYKKFIDSSKTERNSVKEIVRRAEKEGFVPLNNVKSIKQGMRVYSINKDKAVALFVIGEEELESGLNIVGSHIDAPRIDLKQCPLYEDSGLSLLKTHYYGGIKKYQWVTIPLALYGVIIKEDGEKIEISIGDEENDPVFFITDILPHLAKDQFKKNLSEAIGGEDLNVIIGSLPYDDKEAKDKFKLNVLKLLNDKYGITEEDFLTAELEIVPAGKSRDVGIDRGLIAGYGHDDRVCAYTSLKAVLEVKNNKKTAVGLFVDKEEIGSVGSTGMYSEFFNNAVSELILLEKGEFSGLKLRRTLANSSVLSSDVAAAFDPTYPSVLEKLNSPFIGKGVTLVKFTGSKGKSGANDANAEYIGKLRKLFNENNIVWQTGELGKVDQGGGGTIAHIIARYNMDVVDLGVPVLSMHAPYEIVSKADVYMTYKAYKAFFNYYI